MKARFKPLLASFVALPYLLAVLLPFFAVYNVPEAEAAKNFSFFGNKILICTVDGFRLIPVDDLEKRAPIPDAQIKCGLCVLAATGLKFASAAAEFFTPLPTGQNWFSPAGWTENSFLTLDPLFRTTSRDPPYLNNDR